MCGKQRVRLLQDGHGTATYLTTLRCEESEPHSEHYDYSYNQGWHDGEEEPEMPKQNASAWPGSFPWYG
jgi:hypothetical protein